MVIKSQDEDCAACVDTVLLNIDGDEMGWRASVRTAIVLLSKKILPLHELVVASHERLEQLERRAQMLEESMRSDNKSMIEKIDTLTKDLLVINAGISLLKYLVPGVPIVVGAILWVLHLLRVSI